MSIPIPPDIAKNEKALRKLKAEREALGLSTADLDAALAALGAK